MKIDSKNIDEFARTVLRRRLSAEEFHDLVRQCERVGLRAGEEAYLLDLVLRRDLATRLETLARTAAEVPSLVGAMKRLRRWIVAGIIVVSIIGWSVYHTGYRLGYAKRERMVAQDLAWTATAAGLGARRLYDAGIVPFLIDCTLPGWKQIGRQCMPGIDPASQQMFGIPNGRSDDPD